MEITVRLFGLDSEKEFSLTLPEDTSLEDLLNKLKNQRTAEEQEMLGNATTLVNGKEGKGGEPLKDQDKVLILLPLGGG